MATTSYQNTTRGFVKTPHGNIEYRESGNRKLPKLVLLHSSPRSSMDYQNLLAYVDNKFHVIAPTTTGYGDSDRPPYPYETVDEFTQSLEWVLEGLNIEQCSLYGARTGAQIAINFQTRNNDMVKKLILEEPFDYSNDEGRALHKKIHTYYPEKADGSHLLDMWKRAGGEKLSENFKEVTENFMHYLNINSDWKDVKELYWEMGWEGAGPYAICNFNVFKSAQKITCDTLIIHGSESRLKTLHQKYLNTIKNSSGIIVDTSQYKDKLGNPSNISGQFSPHIEPEKWATMITKFINP
ncbi:MAG: alpha/beta hydrolase [Dehalococcoidia bacterium]|jgi:pimeloyl-ACP methyl ester carboxylesterase|nr:MAG: Pimeloyl-ACP methyl ester carboxylesterase [Chloroflexota bacterium]|tara:strand:+ start:3138 stop:4025 length:888 start_codon:yes stop_codon:yes gene_type:complete